MSESLFWRNYVKRYLSSFGMLKRIENLLELGMPDVVYCLKAEQKEPPTAGWIELKYAHEWPKRASTEFHFPHLTKEQTLWLEEYSRIGGKCCVMARVSRDFFLVPGSHCRILRDGVRREELKERAPVFANKIFPAGRMLKWLTERT